MPSSKRATKWKRVLLAGPTAIGKTELSLRLAEEFGFSVISADSRQCYRGMDIGTGKVSVAERERVPHFNIDVLDPVEPDSAAAFVRRAKLWEAELDTAFYVGGSTLHLQGVVWPMDELPEADPLNLARLEAIEAAGGSLGILGLLVDADPDYARTMQGYNRQRAFRALDVWMQTGRPFSSFHRHDGYVVPDDTLILILTASTETLRKRIDRRVDAMMSAGFLDEVDALLASGLDPTLQSLHTVGYRELIEHRLGGMDLPNAIDAIKASTRRYAKRQLTWFRRWEGAVWIDRDPLSEDALFDTFAEAIHSIKS
jgi:tRNA dimethylallyltransferase